MPSAHLHNQVSELNDYKIPRNSTGQQQQGRKDLGWGLSDLHCIRNYMAVQDCKTVININYNPQDHRR